MKIGFDAKRLFLNNTGLGNYSRTLLYNLQKHFPKNDYFLFTPQVINNKETAFFINNPAFTIITPHNTLFPFWRQIGIGTLMKSYELEIYHGLSHELPLINRDNSIKRIVTIHDLIFEKYPMLFPMIDRKMYQWKYRNAAKKAHHIIAVSQQTKEDIQEYWNIKENKISVVYQSCNPVFFSRLDNQPKIREDYFLYVGSIVERKGLLKVVMALNMIPKEKRKRLIIVGDGGAYKRKVLDFVIKNKLEKWIEFRGNVANYELRSIYSGAIALIYPSIYEGFGIPVIEASLLNTPVICSQLSSIPEAAGPAAYYVDPNKIDEISSAMLSVINIPQLARKSALESQVYVNENFNGRTTARSLMDVYIEVLGG